MSDVSHQPMTNHHPNNVHAHDGLFGKITDTLHVWHERQVSRRELAHFSERDIHDAGLSSTDVMYEAGKHFWQA